MLDQIKTGFDKLLGIDQTAMPAPGSPQNLLGDYYDKDEMKRMMISRMLMLGGVGLMGGGWQGAAGGVASAAIETPREYRDMAMDAWKMDQAAQDQAWQDEQRGRQRDEWGRADAAYDAMPEEVRKYYDMGGQGLAGDYIRSTDPAFQTAQSGSPEVFGTVYWDENNQPYVLDKNGNMRRPGGLGEGTKLMDPYATNVAKGAGTAAGKTAGVAAGDLPGARKMADYVKLKIDDIINDPALPQSIGWTSMLPDAVAPNGVINFRSKLSEIQGEAFLQARTMLKGGGQITDFESQKAEAAYSAAVTAIKSSDPQALKDALTRFKEAVDQGLVKLEAQAGPYAPPAPATGGNSGTTSTGVPWSIE